MAEALGANGPTARAPTSIPVSQPTGAELNRRVIYLMLFRLALISLVLGVTILLSWLSDVDLSAPASLVLFAIIGMTYLLSLIYSVLIRRGLDPTRLADAQVAADLVTTTLLVHVTGGPQSAYTFFFPLSIIGAATVRFRAGAVVVAVASIVLFVGVSLAGVYQILPVPAGQRVLPHEVTNVELGRAMALNLAAFAGVAVLAFNLGAQIQRTTASLEVERSAAADLFALHDDIVRSLSSGLITVDQSGEVLSMNRAAGEMLQIAADDALGRPVERILPGIGERVAALAGSPTPRRTDLVLDRRDGVRLVLGITTSPLRDNRDVVVGRIFNFQDLTELRAMEGQVKRAERLAVIGGLAAGVAHEIRNPLASISGSIELLRNAPSGDEDSRPLMDIITREIDRLNVMVDDLLDYASPQPLRRVEFDLAALAHETMQVFEQDRSFDHVALTAADDTVREGLRLTADPGKLRQVLWNLLRNAAEAADSGGGSIEVRVALAGEHASMEVADDGPGVASENLDRLFDPFFTTKSRGSGLGLATCQNIVHEHGGTIRAESEPGKGCRFVVRLPLAATEDVPPEPG
jgi:two-component system sensor histidine kinase PilS (NtrC family)